jgi:putative endonuclease
MGWLARKRIDWIERAVDRLHRVSRRRGSANQPAHLLTGIDGERAAFFYLRRKGYTIVARRWSAGNLPGDIDLIAWQGPVLCFIEVKTRTARDMTPAEVAIDQHKRNILRRLARRYIRQLPGEAAPPVRFDVVSVYMVPGKEKEITHFENYFGWSERRRDWA